MELLKTNAICTLKIISNGKQNEAYNSENCIQFNQITNTVYTSEQAPNSKSSSEKIIFKFHEENIFLLRFILIK